MSTLRLLLAFAFFSCQLSFGQQPGATASAWVDSLDAYGRELYMPADKYKWDWGQATFLHALIRLYQVKQGKDKQAYLDYIKTAMDGSMSVANGRHPNAVASGIGMAFLARITNEEKYRSKAMEIYNDYLTTPRAPNGGVSHRVETVELWDDTVYMLSMFLLEMYRLYGDEKYLAEFTAQVTAHSSKLADRKSGLWVHGWDADKEDYNDGCSVLGWADNTTRKSHEYWGRANGWVAMALADALELAPAGSSYRKTLTKEFNQHLKSLPALQNKITGHWYQLLNYPGDPGNFEESSCTAMFAYAIKKGIRLGVLPEKKYQSVADRAYQGLQTRSTTVVEGKLVPSRVCGGTCIGDKAYYYNRKLTTGTGFGIGAFILLGIEYQMTRK